MRIRAAISAGAAAPFEIAEVELDEPRRDEVLVEVRAVGVCHSDLTMKAVWPEAISPIVLGHEGAGVVARRRRRRHGASGPATTSCSATAAAAPAASARAGHRPYCREFRTLNGIGTRPDGSPTMRRDGAAVYGLLLRPVELRVARAGLRVQRRGGRRGHRPRRWPRRWAAACRPAPAPCSTCSRPRRDASLVVFGAGGVGLSAVMAARPRRGHDHRRRPGGESPGARRGARARRRRSTPARDDVVDAIRELTGGGADARPRHDRQGRGHQPGDRGAGAARHAGAGGHRRAGLRHGRPGRS